MGNKKRFITKKLLIIILFLLSIDTFGQGVNIDSTAIAFKAKLFTVSEYGMAKKQLILKDIENQNLIFLKTKYKHFLFMKISFSQPYRLPNHEIQMLVRQCDYYLAYNTFDSKYYRLGGFDSVDIDSFFKDLKLREGYIFKNNCNEISEINIHCLYSYYSMKHKKRIKKGFKCFSKCSDETKQEIIIN